MRILQIIVILFLIACQSEVSDKAKPAQSQSNSTQESLKEDAQPSQKITNGKKYVLK